MTYSLSCRDAGVACDFVAKGASEDAVLKTSAQHAKEVHGYTDQQLNDPKFLEGVKKIIKKI
jgi:predicted small metal-binding protein